MENKINIYELKRTDEAYLNPVNALLHQLSSSPCSFTFENLEEIVQSQHVHLFIAEADGIVGGMLTLAEYPAPTGRKMWIEDVVVDEAMRGRSLGRLLVEHAIEFAKSRGKATLMLTSRPSRVAANALYRSCGFEFKETNNYKMDIPAAGEE